MNQEKEQLDREFNRKVDEITQTSMQLSAIKRNIRDGEQLVKSLERKVEKLRLEIGGIQRGEFPNEFDLTDWRS